MNIPLQTKLVHFQCPRVRTFQTFISKTTVIFSMSEINRNFWMMLKYIKKTSTTSACIFTLTATRKIICTALITVLGHYLCWNYHFSLTKKKISLYVHNTLLNSVKKNIPATITQSYEMKMVAIISWK